MQVLQGMSTVPTNFGSGLGYSRLIFKNKHMDEQSSTLKPYLYFQARTAWFTNNLAATDLFGAEATMFITSLFVSTSQISKKENLDLFGCDKF